VGGHVTQKKARHAGWPSAARGARAPVVSVDTATTSTAANSANHGPVRASREVFFSAASNRARGKWRYLSTAFAMVCNCMLLVPS
jgi:hypothetical protein